jgi:hypothetical protein
MDPYIEAQRRLDRGEIKCAIDTSFGAEAFNECRRLMGINTMELKASLRMMNEAKRLMQKLKALNKEK